MAHILDMDEQAVQRYMQMTGKTRAELEAERETMARDDERTIEAMKDKPPADPDEKMGQFVGYDIIGDDGSPDGGENTG